jgi:hypothetical protein
MSEQEQLYERDGEPPADGAHTALVAKVRGCGGSAPFDTLGLKHTLVGKDGIDALKNVFPQMNIAY